MPNPEYPRTSRLPLPGALLLVTLGGVIGWGVREKLGITQSFLANNQEIKPSDKVLTSPETSQLTRVLIDQYLETKRRYETILGERFTFDGPPLGSSAPVILELSCSARQHLVDGLYLAKLVLPLEQASSINIEASNQKAILLDRQFDLNNPFHFHLLAAVLELELKNQQNELLKQDLIGRGYQSWSQGVEQIQSQEAQQKANQKIIGNLLWLFDRNPATNIDKDAFPFIPVSYLNLHSQIFQALEQSGLPWPRRVSYIRYFPGAPGAAWYNPHDHRNPFTIDITNNSGDISIIHETGHFMADAVYLDPSNQRLREISQEEYNLRVQSGNLIEDYATSFQRFFLEGRDFRREIQQLTALTPGVAQNLERKYQFMERVFGGKEFTKDGELLTLTTAEYKVGVQAVIPDDSENRLGILLRRYLYSFVDPDLPAVFPGDKMEIIEGPVPGHRIIGGYKLEPEPYWKVRIIYQGYENYKLVGDLFRQEGWMPESLLGEIIQQNR